MNDAERDAWLREALRHAPDSQALPPSGVSEAILAKARAAARASVPGAARGARANPLVALWDWLARPPVAAGFASVMAATLVGLMWWDRPMDEGMPRAPELSRGQSAADAPAASPAPAAAVSPSAAGAASPATATAQAPPAAPTELRVPPNAKAAPPSPAPAHQRSVEPSAKKSVPKPPAKKDQDADRSRAADALESAPERPAAQPVAPSSLASGRVRADERRPAPGAESDAAKAKGLGAASPAPAQAPSPAAPAPAPTPDSAAAATLDDRLQRQRSIGALREKEGAGFASSPGAPSPTTATPFRQELERRAETAANANAVKAAAAAAQAVPPARVLAAVAAEPERWSRQTAAGDTVPLDAGWRAWLADLDAAAAGRWRPLAVGAATARTGSDTTTTLRLVSGGRVAATLRLDGSTVELDASPGAVSDRWQAPLAPATAERLRSSARRLVP